MKHLFKSFLSLMLLLTTAMAVATCGTGGCGSSGSFANSCTTKCDVVDCEDDCESNQCCDDNFFCKTHFSPRSQGSDTARRLVASHLYEHQFDMDKLYGTFAVTFAFQRNFRKNELATYFAPNCQDPCNPCIILGADDQNGVDVRSDDFGLSCTAEVCPCPKYSSFIADLQWWVGLSEWCPGTFFELYIPIVHTWVDYNCCARLLKENRETPCADVWCQVAGSNPPVSGCTNYMSKTGDTDSEKTEVGTTDPTKALRGNFTWGDVENTMCFGKQCCDNIDKTRVADLQFNLGYDFWQTENYHLGFKLILKAPTGNVAEGKFLLEPIVGNGGHFELGGGVTASAILWDKDIDQQVSWHLEADITHLFNSRQQTRVFDLVNNGCYSRYLLLKVFGNKGTSLDGLERGPNVFNSCLKVNAGAQVDITSLWSYRYTCWNVDLAYNFWSRSQEKADADKICCKIADDTYGIKGLNEMGTVDVPNLNTASKATIQNATNTATGMPLVDDPSPVFVGCGDLNICSGLAPSAWSNSVVAHVTYLMEDNDWEPYFGVGGKAEFSGKGNTAMNQWAVWAKGGITF